MRIIIDGTVGSGKTTVVKGWSQRDSLGRDFYGLQSFGYSIFSDLIIDIIADLRKQGIPDPMCDWPLFFREVTRLGIQYYFQAPPNAISFYDRGIYFLEIMAKRYNQRMPDEYYEFINTCRYDEPIFIFETLSSLDMTHPHREDNCQKVYTLQDRLKQQDEVIKIYKKYGYKNIIIVPTYSNDINISVKWRINYIMKSLKIQNRSEIQEISNSLIPLYCRSDVQAGVNTSINISSYLENDNHLRM